MPLDMMIEKNTALRSHSALGNARSPFYQPSSVQDSVCFYSISGLSPLDTGGRTEPSLSCSKQRVGTWLTRHSCRRPPTPPEQTKSEICGDRLGISGEFARVDAKMMAA
jgi:hypothetical protein